MSYRKPIYAITASIRRRKKSAEKKFREKFQPKGGCMAVILVVLITWIVTSGLIIGLASLVVYVINHETLPMP